MPYKSVYACDECQREEPTDRNIRDYPPGWWSFFRESGPEGEGVHKVFCSKDCLANWLGEGE